MREEGKSRWKKKHWYMNITELAGIKIILKEVNIISKKLMTLMNSHASYWPIETRSKVSSELSIKLERVLKPGQETSRL